MVYGRSVTVQRHRHSGNLKVSVTDRPTDLLTGIGARIVRFPNPLASGSWAVGQLGNLTSAKDAYASKDTIFELGCEILILYNIAVWANICKNLSDDYQTFLIPMFVHWPAISNHANCHSKMLILKVFCMIKSNFFPGRAEKLNFWHYLLILYHLLQLGDLVVMI